VWYRDRRIETVNPTDIMRKLLNDIYFIPPQDVEWKLAKTAIAIKRVEKIFYGQIGTEGSKEAIQVLKMLRKYESELEETSRQER
jgi:hypothetical protein